jgi:hypothetical protein
MSGHPKCERTVSALNEIERNPGSEPAIPLRAAMLVNPHTIDSVSPDTI